MDQAIGTTADQFGDAPAQPAKEVDRKAKGPQPTAETENGLQQKHIYAGREWSSDHPLNVRVSIPIGVGRYYVTLVAGKERRARARLAKDRVQHPLDRPGNVLFLFLVATIATAGSLTLLYLLLAHILGWSGRLVL